MSIERNYSGYMFADNNEFQKSIEIKFTGKLKKKLFLNHVFTGSIEVDGIKEQVILKRKWTKGNIFKSMGYNAFIETKNNKTEQYEVIGTLDTSKDFNEVLIRLSKIDSKYNGRFSICGPSSNLAEAKEVITNMEETN